MTITQTYPSANTKTLADRISERMSTLDLTEEAVAKKTNGELSQVAVHKLKTGQSKKTTAIIALSKALSCDPTWLQTGENRLRENVSVKEYAKTESHANVSIACGFRPAEVPLISKVAAGRWCESPETYEMGDAEDWLPKPKGAGERAYALRIEGDSMTSPYPGQRSYPHDTIIYVDPDLEPLPGKRVIAKIPGTNEATFKTLTNDAGKLYLTPINPQYNKILVDEDVLICGVVIGSYLPE